MLIVNLCVLNIQPIVTQLEKPPRRLCAVQNFKELVYFLKGELRKMKKTIRGEIK
jgi:hypothetical protein